MTTARIWLSALPLASDGGSTVVIASVCRYSRPGRGAAGLGVERDALDDAVRHRGDELVQEARHLPRVARDFGDALLVVVELLEGEDRQVDVVLLEAEQARRVVHQHVGVEHEQLAGGERGGWPGRTGRRDLADLRATRVRGAGRVLRSTMGLLGGATVASGGGRDGSPPSPPHRNGGTLQEQGTGACGAGGRWRPRHRHVARPPAASPSRHRRVASRLASGREHVLELPGIALVDLLGELRPAVASGVQSV